MRPNEFSADTYLTERAVEIKESGGRPDLSTLRALDIVLWMHGKEAEAQS